MTEREVDLYKVQAKVVNGAYERGLRVKDVGDDTAPWLVAGLRVVEKKAGEVSREDMVKIDENEKGISLPDPLAFWRLNHYIILEKSGVSGRGLAR